MRQTFSIAWMVLLLAACATGRASEPRSVDLMLLTWNILHGASAEGELNLDAKGRYILGHEADLVFLQEIDENCERSGRIDQMTVLARLTGMDAAFGSFMPYQGGRYGLGTLSSLPVRATRTLRLPEGDEPRVALLREVEVLGRPLLAVNVHFNWTRDDTSRYAQARALLAELETIDLPMIVAGDFNDVPNSRTLEAFFEAGFEPVEEPGPSWNASAPSVDIDHILARSGRGLRLEPLGGEVLEELALSDHRPVRGQIRVLTTDALPPADQWRRIDVRNLSRETPRCCLVQASGEPTEDCSVSSVMATNRVPSKYPCSPIPLPLMLLSPRSDQSNSPPALAQGDRRTGQLGASDSLTLQKGPCLHTTRQSGGRLFPVH